MYFIFSGNSKNKVILSGKLLLSGLFILSSFMLKAQHHARISSHAEIDVYCLNAQFDKAIVIAESLLRGCSNPSDSAIAMLEKSDIYMGMGDIHKADSVLSLTEACIKRIRPENPGIEFRYAMNRAVIMDHYARTEPASRWLNKALALVNKASPSPTQLARLYFELARNSYFRYSLTQAVHYAGQCLTVRWGSQEQDKILAATYASGIAILGSYLINSRLSDKATGKCDSIMRSIRNEDHPGLLPVYLNLSQRAIYTGYDRTKIKTWLDKGWFLLRKHYPDGYYRKGQMFYCLGLMEYYGNDYDNALTYFSQAEHYIAPGGSLNHMVSELHYAKAILFHQMRKDYDKAIHYYNKSLHAPLSGPNRGALIYSNIGRCYFDLGNYSEARVNYMKAKELASRFVWPRDTELLANAYIQLARISSVLKSPEKQIDYLMRATLLANHCSFSNRRMILLMQQWGDYHLDQGYIRESLADYQKALSFCSAGFGDTSVFVNPLTPDFNRKGAFIVTLTMKAFALYTAYDRGYGIRFLKEALECHDICLEALHRLLVEMDSENSEFTWDYLVEVTCNNAVSYASMLYKLTGDPAYAEKALLFSENTKMISMALLNQHKEAPRIADIPEELATRKIWLVNEITNVKNRLLEAENEGVSQDFLQSLNEKLATLQWQGDSLDRVLEGRYPQYFRLKYNKKVLTLKEIQQNLDNDQAIIEYQLLNSELIAIVITRNKISITLTPNDGHEIASIHSLRESVSENPIQKDRRESYNDFLRSSSHLYNRLIHPIYHDIAGKKLVIIPHDELTLVPFELLILKTPSGDDPTDYADLPYLLREFHVSYAYSCAILFDKITGKNRGKRTGIFLPDYTGQGASKGPVDNNLPPLYGAMSEAHALRKLVAGDYYSGTLASEKIFRSNAPGYRILHIAAHSDLNSKIPSLSSLVFPAQGDSLEDGLLHSYELYQMSLNAQLVVLSGCNTGYGRLQYGEGLLSLARSFFFTGVRSVVYTLWPVSDITGTQIIIGFYKELVRGLELQDALRSSKLNYLSRADPVKSHPYFWAGYIITGKTEPIMGISLRSFIVRRIALILLAGLTCWGIWRFIF